MASWSEFTAANPGLASAVRELIHQYGSGLGYLATVRPDGGPRVHPVAPVIMDDGLYCFVIDSPKRGDLDRDGRYALHSFPPEDNDDEAYLSGRARPVTDRRRVERLAEAYRAERRIDWRLYEFSVEVAMVARRLDGGGPAATVTEIWRDERVGEAADGPAMRSGPAIR
ncbi:MAG TPA: pyridoxamine 5'-phosphate oxidase family protein [Rugosimonospora sp.]|jgi:hypothetical protein